MFQNSQLSNLVSQLGIQQQQMRMQQGAAPGTIRASTASPGLTAGSSSVKYNLVGELPRQAEQPSPISITSNSLAGTAQ